LLQVEKLNVAYGIIETVHNVSFRVEEGELVALLGANGAGKTTVLMTVSGLIRPRSGSISFLGRPITDERPSDRFASGLIQVPEAENIFPFMTVKENLLMGGACRREAWEARARTLERVYTVFPALLERADYQARLLSGGERQMLVIARGLMSHPRLMMIDEPSLGLAPIILMQIYRTMELILNEGVTILLSEQNIQQALRIADRGYVLENGRIALEGRAEDLMESEHIKRAYLGL
jgi:branched-chain amino acid transport system ATP-binding protein